MKEKTAVEQFIEQLEKQSDSWENVSMGTINISIKVNDYLKLKEKALEIEKEQHKKSGGNWVDPNDDFFKRITKNAGQRD